MVNPHDLLDSERPSQPTTTATLYSTQHAAQFSGRERFFEAVDQGAIEAAICTRRGASPVGAANAPATPTKPEKDSGQLGDRSNSQQKQQNSTSAKAETAVETETEVQTQTSDEQANSADTVQKSPLAVLLKLPNLNLAQIAQATSAKPTATKSTNQKATPQTNQTANQNATAQNAAATAAAATAQTNAPAQTKPVSNANDSDNTDSTADSTLKPSSSHVNVSPFAAENAAANAAAETETAAATAAAPTTGKEKGADVPATAFADLLPAPTPVSSQSATPAVVSQPAVPQTPVAQFAQANQQSIVSTINGKLLPNGGTMNITLNPPDLGAMQISVHMENGVMSASFETSSDQATRLLTHTLGQLKNALETQGVSVDRLHVRQSSSSDSSSSNDSDSNGQSSSDGRSASRSSSAAKRFAACGGRFGVEMIRWIWWPESPEAQLSLRNRADFALLQFTRSDF